MRVEGMGLLAAQPNVAVKISGLGMADYDDEHYVSVRGCDAAQIEESIRPFVLETIEAFGVERCMLASNFPCAPRTSIRKLAQPLDGAGHCWAGWACASRLLALAADSPPPLLGAGWTS